MCRTTLMTHAAFNGDTSKRQETLNNPCGLLADLLVKVLCSDCCQLWDILMVMYATSTMGQARLNICGPVGTGKSTAIQSFMLLYSLFYPGRFLIVTSQNAPCTELATNVATMVCRGDLLCTVYRLWASNEYSVQQTKTDSPMKHIFKKTGRFTK